MKVLFIDDDSSNLNLYKIYMKGTDAEVTMESNPIAGLELLNTSEYDLCFIDIQMPELTGTELLEKYKQGNPNSSTFFCALTGLSQASDLDNIRDAGFSETLTKPILKKVLVEIIQRHDKQAA